MSLQQIEYHESNDRMKNLEFKVEKKVKAKVEDIEEMMDDVWLLVETS